MVNEVLVVEFQDEAALHRAYMPFVNKGGLFIDTDKKVLLGDRVKISLKLPYETDPIVFVGKVVWITPTFAKNKGKKPGIGVQLRGIEGTEARKKIEAILKDQINADQSTDTL